MEQLGSTSQAVWSQCRLAGITLQHAGGRAAADAEIEQMGISAARTGGANLQTIQRLVMRRLSDVPYRRTVRSTATSLLGGQF